MGLFSNRKKKKALFYSAFFDFAQSKIFAPQALAMLLVAPPALAQQCATDHVDARVTLTRVIDGDTIKLEDGRKVRLVGINAPETGGADGAEPYGMEAQKSLQDLLPPGTPLLLRYGRERYDRYQRLLAHAFLEDGTNVQEWLLERGLAATVVVPPNLWSAACYPQIEQQARAAGRGMWSSQRFQTTDAQDLPNNANGFYILSGRISGVGANRHWTWLELPNNIKLRIASRDLGYFHGIRLEGLKGHRVVARGWMSPYGNGLQMRLRHPAALQTIE